MDIVKRVTETLTNIYSINQDSNTNCWVMMKVVGDSILTHISISPPITSRHLPCKWKQDNIILRHGL